LNQDETSHDKKREKTISNLRGDMQMKGINKKHSTSAILLATLVALLLMQLARANPIEVSIAPLAGPVGTTVTVSGIADTSGGNVSIYFDINGNGQTEVAEFQKNATASVTSPYSYEATITVPPSIAGTHAIIAADVIAGTSTGAYFTVTSEITISPASGPIGEAITVTGTGFDRISVVAVKFDDIDVTSSPAPQTDDVGSFTTSFPAPPSIAGDHIVTATDTAGNTYSTIFTVLGVTISITPHSGPIGTIVTVSGTYATPSESVRIWWDNVEAHAINAEGDGTYSYDLTVPPSVAGAHTVTAEDVMSTNNASETFTLLGITLSITPASGPVGTVVTVTGTYATPGGSVVIGWDSIEIKTVTAELDGTYLYDLTIPASVNGEHTVTVEDVASTNTATQIFTVEPQIILTPEDGVVADSVTVTGTGFSGASQVDVYFDIDKDGFLDAEELILDDVPTDEFGSFESSFSLPWVSTAGNYLITAVDGEGVTDDATFTVLFVMYTRSSEYFQGDYPSFFIQAVNEAGEPLEGAIVVVEVFDPNGYIQYKAMTLTIENGTVPYDMQFFNWWIWYYMETLELTPLHLPSDALVGSWKWTATTNGLTVTGSFEVVEPVDLRTLLEKLDQLLEGQSDIADLISYYGEKLHLEHNELAELIAAVSNELQLDHEELTNLINNVATNLHLEHEDIVALISEVADTLEMKLDALSTLISETVDQLKLDHEELANLISQVANKLQIEHTEIIDLICNISEKLQMDHAELASLVTQVFDALNLKLDDINAGILSIEEKVDGLYVVIGDLDVKLEDINAQLVEVQGNIATIITDIGTIKTDISNINAKITGIEGRLATIETDIGTTQVDIANINGAITSINGQLATITTSIATIQTDISAINGRLTSIEGNIATIVTDIGTIKTDVNSINAKITAIEGRLATIETDIGTIQTDLEDIDAEIVEIKDSMATIKTDVGTIQVKLDTVQAKLVDIQGDLATITTTLGEIETKIDNLGAVSLEEIKGDIATIKSDIGTLKVNVNNINGRIVALEDDTVTIQTDIGTVKTSLEDINAKISVTNGNVATIQTDVGTIKGKVTSIEGDVATLETDIGTVKTSTKNIETTGESIKSDTGLQPATVGLSLIAAIGAIAAAVLVLRKVYMK